MTRTALIVLATLALASAAPAEEKPATTPVDQVEPSAPEPGVLATTGYKPAKREKPFFEKLPAAERTTGSMFSEYKIEGKVGTFVGWFGIVRRIMEDPEAKRTRLLVEMRYFDGLTDAHQQIVSINGGGDFVATLRGTDLGVKRLSLVRIYGKVVSESEPGPLVEAEYVRHWDWGTFAFMQYGEDRTNPQWRKLLTVPPDKAYLARPGPRYYEARLGKRELPSLFERLGGETGVAKLAVEFFLRAREDATLNANPKVKAGLAGTDPEKLQAGFRAYLTRLAGGPGQADPKPVEDALRRLAITAGQWKAGGKVLDASLRAVGVPGAERWELAALVERRRGGIVADGK